MSERVWILMDSYPYEADDVVSAHRTLVGAEAAREAMAARLNAETEWNHFGPPNWSRDGMEDSRYLKIVEVPLT